MATKKRPARKAAGQPAAKRQRKQDDPVWCTESKRSPLVHDDLHALYSNPKTYEKWTREDWEAARQCLPDDAPYNEDGYSVPIEYFKYNTDWRRYVREFQEDLGAGRYEPEWLKQASQAMEERSQGKFDAFKAKEFEEFWGQKQKTHSHEIAGESAKIKLEDLIKHGVILAGDIFSYERVFGKGKDRLMVEKDARVVDAQGGVLTMAVPPGQLKYARYLPTPEMTPEKSSKEEEKPVEKESSCQDSGIGDGDVQDSNTTDHVLPDEAPATPISNQKANVAGQSPEQPDKSSGNDKGPSIKYDEEAPPAPSLDAQAPKNAQKDQPLPGSSPLGIHISGSENRSPEKKTPNTTPQPRQSAEDVVIVSVSTLTKLEQRMVEIDGRIDMKTFRSSNSWKAVRGKRNNQDMGSLFDMREHYYVNQSSTIVKEPQRTTKSGREVKSTKKD